MRTQPIPTLATAGLLATLALPCAALADDVAGDTTTTAALPARTFVAGTFDFEGDSDWYRVTLTGGRLYAVGGTFPRNTTTGLTLRDAAGAFVDGIGPNDPGPVTSSGGFDFMVPHDGTYYVGVHAASAPAYPTAYSLLLDDADCPDSRRSPCTIGAGQTIAGTLAWWEDVDYLWFQARQGLTYAFRVDACEPVDLDVYGRFGDEKAVGQPDASGASLTWRAPQSKWYAIRVIGVDATEQGTPYDLSVSQEARVKPRSHPEVSCAGQEPRRR